MRLTCLLLCALATTTNTIAAQELPMGPLRADQQAFKALYKELVETNTTLSSGSCTLLAQKIAGHLKDAGFAERDITLFSVPENPREGGLVTQLPGSSDSLPPILLLGHLDVVEARRQDWQRDPFTFIEENNYFYGRGTADMKVLDAIWIDALMRFRKSGYHPRRTIRMALTCGEETTYAFNGADWLARNRPELIRAAFALNEGGGGLTDGHGKVLVQEMQVGEKAVQNYRIEATNPGGHSSIPVRENAIYELADALARVRDYEFPVHMSETTRAYFAKAGAVRHDELGTAMVAVSRNPDDQAAAAIVSRDRIYHSMLRTTCVATLLEGGHANNALPQRAAANINCRIFPGETSDATQAALARVIADPKISISAVPPIRPIAIPPKLDPQVLGPAEELVAKYFPGVPVVPSMSTGASDGIFLEAIGIPVYGIPGPWGDPDGNGVHGLNERLGVRSAFVGRDFLDELIRRYADSN